MIKWKFIFDTGKVVYLMSATRTRAIRSYCKHTGASPEWVKKHCRIVNLGKGEEL